MLRRLIVVVSCMLLAGTMFVPSSQASEWSKKTVLTLNKPIEVPGAALPAGTYVFKLAGGPADRDIVQIFNKNETKLFSTILAIPDYRTKTPSKAIVTFEERAKNSPEAVETWFYPGDNYGLEFVYPKERAMVLAKANNRLVLSHEASPQAKPEELKITPVKAVNPAGQEVEVAQAAPPPKMTAQKVSEPKMPHTASDLPLLAMLGIFSLGLALALPRIARVIS